MPKVKAKQSEGGKSPIDLFMDEIGQDDPMDKGGPERDGGLELISDADPNRETPPEEPEEELEEEELEEPGEPPAEPEEPPEEPDELEYDPEGFEEEVIEDELSTLNRAGLINYIKENKLNVPVKKTDTEESIANAIRANQAKDASDPQKLIEFMNQYIGEHAKPPEGQKSEDMMIQLFGGGDDQGGQQQQPPAQQQAQLVDIPTNFSVLASDDDFNRAIGSREGFNTVLQGFGEKIVKEVLPVQQQRFIQTLIPALQNYVGKVQAMSTTISDFYQDYPHLRPVRKLVTAMVGHTSSEKPNASLQEVLKEVADTIDQKFKLREAYEERTQTPPKKRKKASFPGGEIGRRKVVQKKKKVESTADEIQAMMEGSSSDPFEGRM